MPRRVDAPAEFRRPRRAVQFKGLTASKGAFRRSLSTRAGSAKCRAMTRRDDFDVTVRHVENAAPAEDPEDPDFS